MKFICMKCVEEGTATKPCKLKIPTSEKEINLMRPKWQNALRRCVFENEKNHKFTGISPIVEWKRVK